MPRFGPSSRPSWDQLYETAAVQEGLFSAEQAKAAGYSLPLLSHYLRAGKIGRVSRGIYRLVHFPPGEHEDLVAFWLWSGRESVFSHATALSLHQLSDVLPARVHLTLPLTWQKRRLKVPPLLVVHHADVPESDRAWFGAVPVTKPARTINDCAAANDLPDFIMQAIDQGHRRGLFKREDVAPAEKNVAIYRRG